MTLERIDCRQGSDDWHRQRMGLLTASRASQLLTSGGAPRVPQHYRLADDAIEPSSRAHRQATIYATLHALDPYPVIVEPCSALTALISDGRVEPCDPPPDYLPVRKPPTPSGQREALLTHLATEWRQQWSADYGAEAAQFETGWMERGRALEPQARAAFTLETDREVSDPGFWVDADRHLGCSPDGELIDGPAEGLELKCPSEARHQQYLRAGVVPAEYWLQVQFSLWLLGWPRWWFMSYHPHWPSLILPVDPCPVTHRALDEHVPPFVADLRAWVDWARSQGVEPAERMDGAADQRWIDGARGVDSAGHAVQLEDAQ